MLFLVMFSSIFTLSAYIVSVLSQKFYFQKPKTILWFMPLFQLVLGCGIFIFLLYILPKIYNPWIWSELTGLDMTRVGEFVVDLYGILTINCVLTIPFSISFYFRYHVNYQVVKKFPEIARPVITGSSKTIVIVMTILLLFLMTYVFRYSPDYLDIWKIKLAYKLTRNAEIAVNKTEKFMKLYPQSKFFDGLHYFLGKLKYRDLGKDEEAKKNLEVLCFNHPENVSFPEAMKYLIEINKKLNNVKETVILLEQFKKICPHSPLLDDILLLLASDRIERGDKTEAVKYLDEIEKNHGEGIVMEFDKEENFISFFKTIELVNSLRLKL